MSKFEDKVAAAYAAQGWTVFRNGWPDMLLVRADADGKLELKAVEAKSEKDNFHGNQLKVCAVLSTVMPMFEVQEGHGYGGDAPMPRACELFIDVKRMAGFETAKDVSEWITEKQGNG